MKKLKFSLVALMISLSTAVFANSPVKFTDVNALSNEIENIMKTSFCQLEDGFEVTVFFSISEENKIQHLQVASPNQELNNVIIQELRNQEITGPTWTFGKIYELSFTTTRDHGVTSLENLK